MKGDGDNSPQASGSSPQSPRPRALSRSRVTSLMLEQLDDDGVLLTDYNNKRFPLHGSEQARWRASEAGTSIQDLD